MSSHKNTRTRMNPIRVIAGTLLLAHCVMAFDFMDWKLKKHDEVTLVGLETDSNLKGLNNKRVRLLQKYDGHTYDGLFDEKAELSIGYDVKRAANRVFHDKYGIGVVRIPQKAAFGKPIVVRFRKLGIDGKDDKDYNLLVHAHSLDFFNDYWSIEEKNERTGRYEQVYREDGWPAKINRTNLRKVHTMEHERNVTVTFPDVQCLGLRLRPAETTMNGLYGAVVKRALGERKKWLRKEGFNIEKLVILKIGEKDVPEMLHSDILKHLNLLKLTGEPIDITFGTRTEPPTMIYDREAVEDAIRSAKEKEAPKEDESSPDPLGSSYYAWQDDPFGDYPESDSE